MKIYSKWLLIQYQPMLPPYEGLQQVFCMRPPDNKIMTSGVWSHSSCIPLGKETGGQWGQRIGGRVVVVSEKTKHQCKTSNSLPLHLFTQGKTIDWKNHFIVAQNEQFDEHLCQKVRNTTLQFHRGI